MVALPKPLFCGGCEFKMDAEEDVALAVALAAVAITCEFLAGGKVAQEDGEGGWTGPAGQTAP